MGEKGRVSLGPQAERVAPGEGAGRRTTRKAAAQRPVDPLSKLGFLSSEMLLLSCPPSWNSTATLWEVYTAKHFEEAQGSFPRTSKPRWQVLCAVNGPTPCGFYVSAKCRGLCLQSLPIPTQAGSQFPCGPLLLFHLLWLRPGKFRSPGCFYGVKKNFIFHYSLAKKPKA